MSANSKVVEEFITAFAKIQRELNSTAREFLTKFHNLFPDALRVYEPLVDVEDRDAYLLVYMDLPGFKKSEIKIIVAEDFVEVRAEKSEERIKEEDGRRYLQRERFYRRAVKRVDLPVKVRPDSARARLEDGVLTIILQKSGERREVEVSVE